MKKLILVAVALMSAASTFAQFEPGTLSFQPKAGLNIAYLSNADGADPRFMYAAGAEVEYQFTKKISLAGSVLYSKQGAKYDVQNSGYVYPNNYKLTIKMDYINFPIVANFYILKGFALKFGIQPAVNVKAAYSESTYSSDISYSSRGVDIKTFDLSIPVGLSYEFMNRNLVLDARYNIGLTRLIEGDDSRNRVAQITAGIKLDVFQHHPKNKAQ